MTRVQMIRPSRRYRGLPRATFRPRGFKVDKALEQWTLIEDTPLPGGELTFEFVCVTYSGEECVSGGFLRSRAKEMGGLSGQLAAERFLEDVNQIPEQLCPYHLLFPGTIWRDLSGHECLPVLRHGRRAGWYLGFMWVDRGDYGCGDRIVRLVA